MPSHLPGPHELGQNHLIHRPTVDRIVALIASGPTDRRIVEWAAGHGAITRPLAQLGRPVEAVEWDPRAVAALQRAVPPHVAITQGDILRHAPPLTDYDLVSNVPFHITTPVLRRLLRLTGWRRALLLVQWEVARKRAGVGGATLLTAQWWPWFEFALDRRVPAKGFAPRPLVDGGLLVVDRRTTALVPPADRQRYQGFVADVFNGRGRGIAEIARRQRIARPAVEDWLRSHRLGADALPRDLCPLEWVDLFAISRR